MRRLIARQKKLLLSLAGIGSSGLSDISAAHDAYLNETRQWEKRLQATFPPLFRTLSGGSLRKFPRRLGQFPRSLLAGVSDAWGTRRSGH